MLTRSPARSTLVTLGRRPGSTLALAQLQKSPQQPNAMGGATGDLSADKENFAVATPTVPASEAALGKGLFSPKPVARGLPLDRASAAAPTAAAPTAAASIPRFYFPGGADPATVAAEREKRRVVLVRALCRPGQARRAASRQRQWLTFRHSQPSRALSQIRTKPLFGEQGLRLDQFDGVAVICGLTRFFARHLFMAIDTRDRGLVTYAQFSRCAGVALGPRPRKARRSPLCGSRAPAWRRVAQVLEAPDGGARGHQLARVCAVGQGRPPAAVAPGPAHSRYDPSVWWRLEDAKYIE